MIADPDYARIFTIARCLGWSDGYTVALIGSHTRDLDLIFVPWEPHACDDTQEPLLKMIAQACDLKFRDGEENVLKSTPDWTEKPHGRRSCSLYFRKFGDPRWVDIGFMPCGPKSGSVRYAWTVDGMEPDASGAWIRRDSSGADGVGASDSQTKKR